MLFISRKNFITEVNRQVSLIQHKQLESLVDKFFNENLGKSVAKELDIQIGPKLDLITDEDRMSLKCSIEQEMFKYIDSMRRKLTDGRRYSSDRVWWEEYEFQETIGSEVFLDALVERINKKQVKTGL